MSSRLSLVTLLVDDYDAALRFYVDQLGFELVEDTLLAAGKRWVIVKPTGGETGLLLARAVNPRQRALVGEQMGGRVGFFLETHEFMVAYARLQKNGVHFVEEPRTETYGKVAVFEDLYGNRWDLIELKASKGSSTHER